MDVKAFDYSGFQQGFIASVLNQPYLQIERFINESWEIRTGSPMSDGALNILWSFLNVCFPIATIFGQLAANIICAKFGRKKTAILATALYIPGTLLCACTKWLKPWFELLFVGRIIWSWANGLASVCATVWIVECAPPKIRGRVASMQELGMSIGSLATQGLGVLFSTDELWPFNFLPNIIIAIVNILMFVPIYESPQFIMEKYGDYDLARKALASYHGCAVGDESIDSEIRIVEASLNKNKKKPNDLESKLTKPGISSEFTGNQIMFMPWKAKDPTSQLIRHAAWLGVMVKIAYVFTGARCLRSYSTFLLYDLSHWGYKQANFLSFLVGILRIPVTLLPVFLVDRLGRRPLIIGSTIISFFSLVLMLVSIDLGGSWKIGTFVGLSVLLLINACGIGSVSRFYSAELVPRNLLLSSVATLTMFEALTKIASEFAFYPVANVIGAQSLLMFIVPTAVFVVLMWKWCPETKRKTVNEVLNEMAQQRKLDISFPM
ncbi:hypothetical protein WR25_19467 [Diploscapter pachys]|uniref:Major facilitator superfamily (MFS) profile domain-containing protein n=1 Tax=Diploscapter pachys TaxID=2018661 RepID=A0A2A2KLD5_9BILA|nr:hypothetical protein WR25_19467 [Diploscapter pachys]